MTAPGRMATDSFLRLVVMPRTTVDTDLPCQDGVSSIQDKSVHQNTLAAVMMMVDERILKKAHEVMISGKMMEVQVWCVELRSYQPRLMIIC
jgi:hypothetical protein